MPAPIRSRCLKIPDHFPPKFLKNVRAVSSCTFFFICFPHTGPIKNKKMPIAMRPSAYFRPSSNSTTFPCHFRDAITRLVQTHITVGMKNEMLPLLHPHVLPKITGDLRTPWMHLMSSEVDGTLMPSLSKLCKSKANRCACTPYPNGQLRVLDMVFLMAPAPSEVKSYTPTS